MGIPQLKRWLKQRFSSPGLVPHDLVYDFVLFDLNTLLHQAHGLHLDCHQAAAEQAFQLILEFFHVRAKLNFTNGATPTVVFCIDGPAPIGKLPIQRMRREGRNCDVTVGSLFLTQFCDALSDFSRTRLLPNLIENGLAPTTARLRVLLSGSSVPGEGEVKMAAYALDLLHAPSVDIPSPAVDSLTVPEGAVVGFTVAPELAATPTAYVGPTPTRRQVLAVVTPDADGFLTAFAASAAVRAPHGEAGKPPFVVVALDASEPHALPCSAAALLPTVGDVNKAIIVPPADACLQADEAARATRAVRDHAVACAVGGTAAVDLCLVAQLLGSDFAPTLESGRAATQGLTAGNLWSSYCSARNVSTALDTKKADGAAKKEEARKFKQKQWALTPTVGAVTFETDPAGERIPAAAAAGDAPLEWGAAADGGGGGLLRVGARSVLLNVGRLGAVLNALRGIVAPNDQSKLQKGERAADCGHYLTTALWSACGLVQGSCPNPRYETFNMSEAATPTVAELAGWCRRLVASAPAALAAAEANAATAKAHGGPVMLGKLGGLFHAPDLSLVSVGVCRNEGGKVMDVYLCVRQPAARMYPLTPLAAFVSIGGPLPTPMYDSLLKMVVPDLVAAQSTGAAGAKSAMADPSAAPAATDCETTDGSPVGAGGDDGTQIASPSRPPAVQHGGRGGRSGGRGGRGGRGNVPHHAPAQHTAAPPLRAAHLAWLLAQGVELTSAISADVLRRRHAAVAARIGKKGVRPQRMTRLVADVEAVMGDVAVSAWRETETRRRAFGAPLEMTIVAADVAAARGVSGAVFHVSGACTFVGCPCSVGDASGRVKAKPQEEVRVEVSAPAPVVPKATRAPGKPGVKRPRAPPTRPVAQGEGAKDGGDAAEKPRKRERTSDVAGSRFEGLIDVEL